MNPAIINKISANLRVLADGVEQASHVHKIIVEIDFPSIQNGYPPASLKPVLDECNEFKKSKYLYIMEALEHTDILECYHAFSDARNNTLDKRAYARLNEPSETFYVGTSKSFSSRLKQHFGYASPKIFALHLSHWIQDIQGGIKLTAFRYSSDIEPKVLQAIEDGLWEEMLPMFGRQGAK